MSHAADRQSTAVAVRPPAKPASAPALRTAAAALALLLGSGHAAVAGCQDRFGYGIRPEARVDALLARRSALHAGVGASMAPATYLRVSLIAAGGMTIDGDDGVGSGRAELTGRFMLDPFRQHRLGGYAGAGIGLRGESDDCCRPLLILLAGAEGPHVRGRTTAFELGYGGGVRIGLAIRSTPQRFR